MLDTYFLFNAFQHFQYCIPNHANNTRLVKEARDIFQIKPVPILSASKLSMSRRVKPEMVSPVS